MIDLVVWIALTMSNRFLWLTRVSRLNIDYRACSNSLVRVQEIRK